MLEFFSRLFGRTDERSGSVAKKRLQLVLVQDRSNMSPEVLEDLKEDLIEVLTRYLDIDEVGMSVDLDRSDESVALVASIPVKSVKVRSPKSSSVQPAGGK